MKKFKLLIGFALILVIIFSNSIYSQIQLTASTVQTINFTGYDGSGFASSPAAGQLDSDTWETTGISDSDGTFGGDYTTGDFARSSTTTSETIGGFYAFSDGGDIRFMIQPTGVDWEPGTVVLKIQNVTGSNLTKLNIQYDIYVNNDQGRSSSFNFSYSTDNSSYTDIGSLDYTSTAASDTNGMVKVSTKTTSITGLSISINSFIYIRWSGAAVDGSGSRDEFALDNILLSPENAPLPVELTSFSALPNGNSVQLNWSTATEVNNFGFDVERASSSTSHRQGWKKIGFVAGHGNSNSPINYSFIDKNPLWGTSFYYRLKQVDVDGKFEYSDALFVNLNVSDKPKLLQNSPNPFNPSTSIKFFIPNQSDVTIKVYDLLGREVTTLINNNLGEGFHIVFWNGVDNHGEFVSSGVYLYRLTAGDFVETKKMLLLK